MEVDRNADIKKIDIPGSRIGGIGSGWRFVTAMEYFYPTIFASLICPASRDVQFVHMILTMETAVSVI